MPQRQMDKLESKYDLWQWLKVSMALRRLKAETRQITEAIANTADHALGCDHLINRLKEKIDDIITIETQLNHMDAVMDKDLKAVSELAIDQSLP